MHDIAGFDNKDVQLALGAYAGVNLLSLVALPSVIKRDVKTVDARMGRRTVFNTTCRCTS